MTRMLCAALALSMLVLAPAGQAAHETGQCHTFITQADTICRIYFRGLPTAITATVSTYSGTATVHAWVDLNVGEEGLVYTPAVLNCSASGNRFARCSDSLTIGSLIDSQERSPFFLTCHVHVTGSIQTGQLDCISATGQ